MEVILLLHNHTRSESSRLNHITLSPAAFTITNRRQPYIAVKESTIGTRHTHRTLHHSAIPLLSSSYAPYYSRFNHHRTELFPSTTSLCPLPLLHHQQPHRHHSNNSRSHPHPPGIAALPLQHQAAHLAPSLELPCSSPPNPANSEVPKPLSASGKDILGNRQFALFPHMDLGVATSVF